MIRSACSMAGTEHNYPSISVNYFDTINSCSDSPAIYDNITYQLGWTASHPATAESVMGVCLNYVVFDHYVDGREEDGVVSIMFNCTFASDSSSVIHGPAARYWGIAVAASSVLLSVAVGCWL